MRFAMLLLTSLFLWPSVSSAQGKLLYNGISIDEAVGIFSDVGLTATRKTSKSGQPYLGGRIGDYTFEVHFSQCAGDKSCEIIHLVAPFASAAGATHERINNWNYQMMVTRAYIDKDTNALLRMDIPAKGGLTKANIEYYLNVWQTLTPKFAEYVAGGSL